MKTGPNYFSSNITKLKILKFNLKTSSLDVFMTKWYRIDGSCQNYPLNIWQMCINHSGYWSERTLMDVMWQRHKIINKPPNTEVCNTVLQNNIASANLMAKCIFNEKYSTREYLNCWKSSQYDIQTQWPFCVESGCSPRACMGFSGCSGFLP